MIVKVGDLFYDYSDSSGWIVEGVHLGSQRQEDVVEIYRRGVLPPSAHGNTVAMYVPLRILIAAVKSGELWHCRCVTHGKTDASE